jgi:hypothetical protein
MRARGVELNAPAASSQVALTVKRFRPIKEKHVQATLLSVSRPA